jgi:hypothetical protein
MRTIRNFAVLFAIGMLAAAMGASRASAQEFHGKFTLRFPALWGTTSLPPGNYDLDVERAKGGQRMLELRSEYGQSIFVVVMAETASPSVNKNAIVCIRQGSTRIVRSLELSAIGETLDFHLPKGAAMYAQKGSGKEPTLLAQGPVLTERIRVETAR